MSDYEDDFEESWDDEENWSNDDFEDAMDDEVLIACPDCGADMYLVSDCCNACGYWLLDAEREKLVRQSSATKGWRYSAKVVIVFVLALLMSGVALIL